MPLGTASKATRAVGTKATHALSILPENPPLLFHLRSQRTNSPAPLDVQNASGSARVQGKPCLLLSVCVYLCKLAGSHPLDLSFT